jgi:hypothetical protein
MSSQAPSDNTAQSAIALSDTHHVSLKAQLHYARDSQTFYLQYEVRNDSKEIAIAVFDRGVYGDWAGVAYAPGPVGKPHVAIDGGAATLTHSAIPANESDMRTTPLAVRVAPGDTLNDAIIHVGFDGASPTRVRWCVAIAPFDETQYRAPQSTDRGTIWMATADAVARQTMLCTPWYDTEKSRFEV